MENNNNNSNQGDYNSGSQQSNNGGYRAPEFNQFNQYGEKLPGETTSLTLGIIGLVIVVISCVCYFIPVIISLILCIIGLVAANKSLKLYRANPQQYSPSSYKTTQTGRVLNIIGLVLSGLVCSLFLIIIIIFGTAISTAGWSGILEEMEKNDNSSTDDYYYDSETDDVIEEDTDLYQYEDELDSLSAPIKEIDSITIIED